MSSTVDSTPTGVGPPSRINSMRPSRSSRTCPARVGLGRPERFAEGAGLTLHVRLLHGKDSQHVLDAIFKALGVALAQACSTKGA